MRHFRTTGGNDFNLAASMDTPESGYTCIQYESMQKSVSCIDGSWLWSRRPSRQFPFSCALRSFIDAPSTANTSLSSSLPNNDHACSPAAIENASTGFFAADGSGSARQSDCIGEPPVDVFPAHFVIAEESSWMLLSAWSVPRTTTPPSDSAGVHVDCYFQETSGE